MNLQPQCKQEDSTSTELDNILFNLREEVGYNTDLLQTLFYTANKLKTIQEVASESNKCSPVSSNPPSSLEELDYQIAVQRRNNQKLSKLVNHLNQVI